MADEVLQPRNPQAQEKKDDTAGLGTLIGLGAIAAVPFLKPFRDLNKVKRAVETIESQVGSKTPRVIAEEAQVVPQLTYSPDKTKVNYVVKEKAPSIEPLLNDRNAAAKPMFGSAAYDAVKMSPKAEMTADEWLNFFKSKQNVKYNDGRSASIQMEELFDTNIADLDKSGNLVGGLLLAAKNINAPISKELLLRQIQNNPINQMKLAEFKPAIDFTKTSEDLIDNVNTVMNLINTKYPQAKSLGTYTRLEQVSEYINGLKMRAVRNSGQDLPTSDLSGYADYFRNSIKDLTKGNIDPQDKRILQDALKKFNADTEKFIMGAKDPYKLQHNSSEIGTYKLPGEINPREIVWYYPKKIPTNEASPTGGHFSIPDKTVAEPASYPLVHTMFGTRFTPKGEKVFSINEIQSDVQQNVFQQVREQGKKRINPFNTEGEVGLLIKPKEGLQEKINTLLKKGMYATEEEAFELNRLIGQQRLINKQIKTKTGGADLENAADYLPMYDTKQYTDYAVKTVARKAAEEGAQWVSVVPVNTISRGNGAVPGNELVYGYANGKGVNKKGEAIIPEIMRKLANQYKTEAKAIQVAKSDPEKPWKVVSMREINRYDKKGGSSVEVFKTKHHQAAFKTKEEAQYFAGRYAEGGGNKVEFITKEDPNLYELMYSLRVTPDMAVKPFKLYKHTGGLIEDIFKVSV